ncbi:MAG TPA: winged helix-turn-helix domain-containing protein [Solirubrobacterales bacterium]|nr:winged helix-turn-helix domain-containing protein [Solirubrobacterales bacterium]
MATKTEKRSATQNRLVAMSHPLRADILKVLSERTASPKEIADELGESIPNVSHHAKRLVQLGCAELVDKRQVRGAIEHFYRATERPLVDTEEWNELHPLVAEELVCDFMQSGIDDFVSSVRARMLGSDERFHLTRTRLVLDEEGMTEALEIQERARVEIMEAQARAADRMTKSEGQGFHVSSWLGCFEVPPVTGGNGTA